MVDDHPIIIEGYQNVLMSTKEDDQTLLIDTANNCDTAQLMINRASKATPYDVCFFDISLPASEDGRYASGEDLALLAKKIMPDSKIIILTMFTYILAPWYGQKIFSAKSKDPFIAAAADWPTRIPSSCSNSSTTSYASSVETLKIPSNTDVS